MKITTLARAHNKEYVKHSNKTKELVNALLLGDQKAIASLYHWFRAQVFDKVAKRFSAELKQELEEVYHDALIATIKIIKKTAHLENGEPICDLKNAAGMIRVIMTRLILKRIKKRMLFVNPDEYLLNVTEETDVDLTQELRQVLAAFEKLGEKCKDLISAKLIHGMSFDELIQELVDDNIYVVTSEAQSKRKNTQFRQEQFRCMKKLRAYFLNLK